MAPWTLSKLKSRTLSMPPRVAPFLLDEEKSLSLSSYKELSLKPLYEPELPAF